VKCNSCVNRFSKYICNNAGSMVSPALDNTSYVLVDDDDVMMMMMLTTIMVCKACIPRNK